MPPTQPTKPELAKVPYSLFAVAESPRFSPRAGLLAISRVYRSLGLPDLMGSALLFDRTPSADTADPSEQAKGHSDAQTAMSNLVESLILLQTAGADCVHDCGLLEEECLKAGLGYEKPPTSGEAEAFLRRLGQNVRNTNGLSRVHEIMAHLVNEIWKTHNPTEKISFATAKHVTIDVVTLQGAGSVHRSPHVDWAGIAKPAPFPCRILCLWREADLVLGGGDCPDVQALIHRIDEALKVIPNTVGKGRLIRAGSVCCNSKMLSWLGDQSNPYKIKVGYSKTRHTPVGFIVAVPLANETLLSLDQVRDGWSSRGIQPSLKISWKKHVPENPITLSKPVRYIAFRQSPMGPVNEPYMYALVVTNRDRAEGDMVNWYLRDARSVNQVVRDIEMLASGSNQAVLWESTGEGRFQLAMLTYNLLTAIRFRGFPKDSETISVSRLRELLIHTTGRIVKGKGEFNLKLSQAKALTIFGKLKNQFPVDEKARTKRRKRQQMLVATTTKPGHPGA